MPVETTMHSDHLVAESEAFFTSLDRSALGEFSLDIGVMVIADTAERHYRLSAGGVQVEGFSASDIQEDLNYALYTAELDSADVLSEVYFWWRRDEKLSDYATSNILFSPKMTTGIERLELIHDHPEMHGYFASGIWGTDFVARCVSEGIDPAMAVALYGVR